MRITIETIPHDDQRYPTLGDWTFDEGGNLNVKVSTLGDPDYEFLIGLHEMIEAFLCHKRGIRQEDVDEFDRTHRIFNEPGAHPEAPYRHEHAFAEAIERLMAHELGVFWPEYEQVIEALE